MVYNLKIYILFKLYSRKIHTAIFTFYDNYGIIILSKVWTPFDRIKKTKDCNYCYAPGLGKYWSEN